MLRMTGLISWARNRVECYRWFGVGPMYPMYRTVLERAENFDSTGLVVGTPEWDEFVLKVSEPDPAIEPGWYTIVIDFAAKDYDTAERLSEDALSVICGGEIGLGLHVCQRHDWVMSFGPMKAEQEPEEFPRVGLDA